MFGSFTTQEEIFDQTLRPIVDDVMSGFEATVFAYGQTGTGKTYTMEGVIDDPENMGKFIAFTRLRLMKHVLSFIACIFFGTILLSKITF